MMSLPCSYCQGYELSQYPMTPPPQAMPTLPYPFPPTVPGQSGAVIPGVPGPGGQVMFEQSYIENILRLNRGKVATVYMTFENNTQWNAKIFRGTIETAGRDHLILSDPQTGQRYLLRMVNFDYATFDEPLNYEYPLAPTPGR